MIIAMSGNLVDIVSAMRPDSVTTGDPKTISEMVARFSSSNGTFGGIIAQCLFFGVQVYFNFFYALRALTTAILILHWVNSFLSCKSIIRLGRLGKRLELSIQSWADIKVDSTS